MISLKQSLLEHHLITLRVMGEWWELDLTGHDKMASAAALSEALQALNLEEELNYIPAEEAAAMRALIQANGRVPAATYQRDYGTIREMGPGKLEREEPWMDPQSVTEALWYRGFLFRGFDETEDGLVEFFYLPDEIMSKLVHLVPDQAASQPVDSVSAETQAPSITATKPKNITSARDDIVDDMTTLLAFAQRNPVSEANLANLNPFLVDGNPSRRTLLLTLATEMGLLKQTADGIRPLRTAVDWLKLDREAQLRALFDAWSSSAFNELRHIPELVCEGSSWHNDPVAGRSGILEVLPPDDDWFSLAALTALVKETNPDFQRPDGDYDTWYIREKEASDYLNGFENWQRVEGRLIEFLLIAPMHWLGLTDLGNGVIHLTARARAWLEDRELQLHDVSLPIIINPNATIIAPKQTSRFLRFQTARIAEPQPLEHDKPYLYRLTPSSLKAASEQGIGADRVLQFLSNASGNRPIPASTKRAIERWGERGTEAQMEQVVILRVKEARVLETLRKNAKTSHLIGESLGDLSAIVRQGEWAELRQIAAQLGLLIEWK